MLKDGVNLDISNAEYHLDDKYISSSGLKLVLKSPKEYYERYILKLPQPNKNQAALDFGTVAHTMLLEPHLFDNSFTVFPGASRRGKAYDIFRADNPDKIILTDSDMMKLNALSVAFKSHTHSGILDNCLFEHTMATSLRDVKVKARADAIDLGRGRIIDVKTTAYAGGVDIFKDTIEKLSYDLSAALYCRIAEQIYNRPFEFYFIVLSKNDLSCAIYRMGAATFSLGDEKLTKSIETLKTCILTNIWSHDILSEDDNSILEV